MGIYGYIWAYGDYIWVHMGIYLVYTCINGYIFGIYMYKWVYIWYIWG